MANRWWADLGWGASHGASLQQKVWQADMKAAIQRELTAHRAIILMEDYLQTEEGGKQKEEEVRKTRQTSNLGGGDGLF